MGKNQSKRKTHGKRREKKTENTGNNIKLYNKTKLGYYKSYQK